MTRVQRASVQFPKDDAGEVGEARDVGVKVAFVGGPTAVLEVGGLRLMTDPTLSPADAVGRIDVVLLSHDQHIDNFDPAGREVAASAPLTLTTLEAAERLGGTAQGLASWQRAQLPLPDGGSLQVTAVTALHGPADCEQFTGKVVGFVLRGQGLPTVYVSGDNASLEVVKEMAPRIGRVELALLFAGAARTPLFDGAPLTLIGGDAAEAACVLAARWVVPLPVRGWEYFSEGPNEARRAFVDAGLADRLRMLEPGETTRI